MTKEEFIVKARTIHENNYNYDKVNLNDKKLNIICSKHGSFFQTLAVHIYDRCGCPKCAIEKKRTKTTTEQFVKKAQSIWGNYYNYNNTIYTGSHAKVIITCPKHGNFEIKAYAHVAKQPQGCKQCGYKNRKHPHQKTTSAFIAQAQAKWGNTYDYSATFYENKTTKLTYVCKVHGVQEQYPLLHLKHGCQYCSGRGASKHSKQSFVGLANKIHGNKYNYDKVEFLKITDYVVIGCSQHGDFVQRANNHIHLANGCPKCVAVVSRPQQEIIDFIKSNYDGVVTENDRVALGGKEIDVYMPDLKMGIEYHGIFYHLEMGVGRKYHYDKWKLAHDRGIRLLQIYGNEWDDKKKILKSKILNLLGKSSKVYARKTKIIDSFDVGEFLDKNHLQSRDKCSVCYGLEYDGEVVACMTFGPSRFNRNYDWELLRFCCKCNMSVVGGASKLLSHFLKNHSGSIVTYADKRYSEGGLYRSLGFRLDGETKPSFMYFNLKNNRLYNRMNYRKYNLANWDGYSENKTAYEIMLLNGFDRIWDAGQYRFVINHPLK